MFADDFFKYFASELKKYQLGDGQKDHNKPSRLSDAEVITILILFQSNGFRFLKYFYTQYVCKHIPTCPLRQCHTIDLKNFKSPCCCHSSYSLKVLLGTCTGIEYVDSTPLRVSKHQRILIHKTFNGIAKRGKYSMG